MDVRVLGPLEVRGDDGARYILRRDFEILVWELEVYEAAEEERETGQG